MRKVMGPVSPGPTDTSTQFKKGRSGNRNGRPKGARNRLCEAFLEDMLADWEAHGKDAIEAFRTERPNEYVKVMAGLMPREFNMKVNELEELSDDQIDTQLAAALRELAADGFDPAQGEEATEGGEPARPLPTLQ